MLDGNLELRICHFNFLAFIFDVGPFGQPPSEEIHADVTLPRDNISLEIELKSDQYSIGLRQFFYKTFPFDITDYLGDFENGALLGVLTVIISLVLATDHQLRATFTANYRGKIPLITQTLLKVIGIGISKRGFFVRSYDLVNQETLEIINALYLQANLLNPEHIKKNFNNSDLLFWFELLQNNDSQGESSYFPSVPFEPVVMTKTELSPLYDLWVENGKVWWQKASDFSNLPILEKRFYLLLAVVLNLRFSDQSKFLSPLDYDYTESLIITDLWPNQEDLVEEFIKLIFSNQQNYPLTKLFASSTNYILNVSSLKQVILQEDQPNKLSLYVPNEKDLTVITVKTAGKQGRYFSPRHQNDKVGLINLSVTPIEFQFESLPIAWKLNQEKFLEGIKAAQNDFDYYQNETNRFKFGFNLNTGFYDFFPVIPKGFNLLETVIYYCIHCHLFIGKDDAGQLNIIEENFQLFISGNLNFD